VGSSRTSAKTTPERPSAVGRFLPARNLLKTWLFLTGACAAIGGLAWLAWGTRGASIGVFCVLLTAATIVWNGEKIVAGIAGAEELPAAESPACRSTVERLAARAHVAMPRLYVLRDGHPRAFVAGRGPSAFGLAASTGLLQALPPAELDGVLAHELAHARNRDVLPQTAAVVVAAALVEVTRVTGFLQRAFLFVLGPIASAFVHVLLSPKRELMADLRAAEICESPHGLADALIRLEQTTELVEVRASPATAPLYTVDPFPDRGLPGLFSTHPPPAERIARLRELDPDWSPLGDEPAA
jgi:heat shock protein HtpX